MPASEVVRASPEVPQPDRAGQEELTLQLGQRVDARKDFADQLGEEEEGSNPRIWRGA